MENGDNLRRISGQAPEKEHAQNSAQYRQRDKLTHGVEEGGDPLGVHHKGGDNNGDTARDGSINFAHLHTVRVGGIGFKGGAVQVQGKHGGSGVQH